MHCPSCGKKMRKLKEHTQPAKGFHYEAVHYHCNDCDSRWWWEYDSMNQEPSLTIDDDYMGKDWEEKD